MVKLFRPNQWKLLIISLSAIITITMITYESIKYPLAPSIFGLHTVGKLVLLSVFFALLGRTLLVYVLRTERPRAEATSWHVPGLWRPVFFLDLNAPIYLAVGVLTNVPAAVLTAIITQILLQFYTAFTRLISWTEAWYRIASTTLMVYATCKIYKLIAGPSYVGSGLTTPEAILAKYAPTADNNDPVAYATAVEASMHNWRSS